MESLSTPRGRTPAIEAFFQIVNPRIGKPVLAEKRWDGEWIASHTSAVYPNTIPRLKLSADAVKLVDDKDGDVIVKISRGPGLEPLDVLCSSANVATTRKLEAKLRETIDKLDPSNICVLDFTRHAPEPTLFLIQLLHCKDKNGPLPHRPSNNEELLDIMDMALRLKCLPQLLEWIKSFTLPDGTSRIVGIQGAVITLEMAISLHPSAPVADFPRMSAEFVKRSSTLSLALFPQTHLGASLNDAIFDSLRSLHGVLLRTLYFRIEDIIVNMTKTHTIYPDSRKSCSKCSHEWSLDLKSCRTCGNKNFQTHYCSPQSRGGVFMEALFEAGLFPLGAMAPDVTPTMIIKKAKKLQGFYHQCKTVTGKPCNLRDTLDNMHVELARIMNSCRGLCGDCARQGRESRLDVYVPECRGEVPHALNAHIDAHESRIVLSRRGMTGLDEDVCLGPGGGAVGSGNP